MNRTPAPRRLLVSGLLGLSLVGPALAEQPAVPAADPVGMAAAEPAPATSPLATPNAFPATATSTGTFPENTLAGIYELALENDLTLERARAELRAGEESRKLALAGLLPQVQAGAGYIEGNTQQETTFTAGIIEQPFESDTDTETTEWNVSLRQPVFDLPAWFNFQRGVDLSRQAESQFAVAQQSLMVRTVAAYTGVLRAAANLRASQAQEQAFAAQLDQVRQRFDVGMVAITDVHEAQAAFDLAVARRLSDAGELGTRREQLTLLTGRPHGDLWELDDRFPVVDPDPVQADEWVTFALQNNFDIQVALNARDAARNNSQAARSEHLPTVDLSLSYLDSDTDVEQTQRAEQGVRRSDFPNNQERTVVALNLFMPLYSGGFISANRRQAEAFFDAQRSTYDNTVRTVTQETRALHIRVVADVATTAARAQAVTSTKSALEAAEVGYEVGTRNVVDVLNAQREYFSALRDYENSIVDYVQDLFLLKRLAGTLSPADIYELNRWLVQPAPATLTGNSPAGQS
jgi:outer membrane protein